jgi:ribonuclease HII
MPRPGSNIHPNIRSGQFPTYEEETALLDKGYSLIAGLDEVGRGPLAGPVVAGVVILPPNIERPWTSLVRDSKLMTPAQREAVAPYIEEEALGAQTGAASAEEIDTIGIVRATNAAMKRALHSLALMPQYLLLDAFPLPGVDIPQNPIVHGDALCLSIAAASVVAKVARDKIMVELDAIYPGYGFASNKGYASRQHMLAIEELGPCPVHRYSFAPVKNSGARR